MRDDEVTDVSRPALSGEGGGMIDRLDHFVLTVRSLEATCDFCERVLGMQRTAAKGRPTALRFGRQNINIHEVGHTFDPKAASPTPGAGDFCLITTRLLADVRAHLHACEVSIELGPIARDGAGGRMTSIYVRDPDGNLVEISRYDA